MEFFTKIKNNLKNIFKSPWANSGHGKRFFVILLLFFIASGAMVPINSKAFWPFDGIVGEIGNGFLNVIIKLLYIVPVLLTAIPADIAEALFNVLLSTVQSIKYTSSDAVNIGWPIVRDLSNMFIILGLVVIGLATILRFRNYEAQKLLIPLIVAALLINFSLVICGVIIDVSNLAITSITKNIGGGLAGYGKNIAKALNFFSTGILEDNFIATMLKASSLMFFNVVSLIIFTLYFSLFLFRVVALYILVILSPLAFVAYVFPFSKKFFSMWWNNFIQWCFIGLPAALFIYIGAKMSQAIIDKPLNFTGVDDLQDIINKIASFLGIAIIPTAFLIVGFLFALKTSAMGADIITNRANKAWGGIRNYAGKGAKALGGKATGMVPVPGTGTSLAGLYTSTRNKVSEGLEKAGLITAGANSSRKDKAVSAFSGDLKNAKDDQIIKLAEGTAISEADKDKKAAAIKEAQERGIFNQISADKREAAVKFAISRGGNTMEKLFTKEQPHLVTGITDQDAINKLKEEEMKRLMIADPLLRKFEAEQAVNATTAKPVTFNGTTYTGYTPIDAVVQDKRAEMVKEKTTQKKIGYKDVTDSEARNSLMVDKENEVRESCNLRGFNKQQTEEEVKKELAVYKGSIKDTDINTKAEEMTKTRMQEKSLGYESASYDDARQKIISEEVEKLKNAGKSGAEIDQRIEAFNNSITFDQVKNKQEETTKERKIKAIKKMGYSKIQEFSAKEIEASEDILEHVDAGTFKSAYTRLTTEQKDEYRKQRKALKKKLVSELRGSSLGSLVPTKPTPADIIYLIDGLKKSAVAKEKELAKSLENIFKNLVTTT